MRRVRWFARSIFRRQIVQFGMYLLRWRKASTSVSAHEHELLERLAAGRRCVVEIGVHEGRTSRVLAGAMGKPGILYLVDLFPLNTRFERLLRTSFAGWIARREMERCGREHVTVCFIERTSEDAAQAFPRGDKAEFVFIDARHDYESARQDFLLWRRHLAPRGIIALHDSRRCDERPDLDRHAGPVRVAQEILEGRFGPWSLAGEAGSILAVRSGVAGAVAAD